MLVLSSLLYILNLKLTKFMFSIGLFLGYFSRFFAIIKFYIYIYQSVKLLKIPCQIQFLARRSKKQSTLLLSFLIYLTNLTSFGR